MSGHHPKPQTHRLLCGCLDGQAGFAWCTLQAFYEYLIVLKSWEMQQQPIASGNKRQESNGVETNKQYLSFDQEAPITVG